MMGRADTPSLGIIDSRSIKSSHHVASDRGIDGNKKIKGRKEHIVVDTLGLPMSVVVHEANVHDSAGAHSVIDEAVAEAKAQGIQGKETTPFLLARIKDLTGGDSLASNIQLVLNNARLAARTAALLVFSERMV